MMMYYPRYIEQSIKRAMHSSGAVLVTGPKFCGKTTTCMRFQKSNIKLNTNQMISLVSMNPRQALAGERPRLIDEWQKVPDIWNYVKEDLDEDYAFGKYILTGSTTPVDKSSVQHSGAGRITPVPMRTMSLFESGDSEGLVSLADLFDGKKVETFNLNEKADLEHIAFLICRGGWPISLVADRGQALDITRNYYNSLFIFEESENERFRNKKPEVLKMILRSYARAVSTEASVQTILKDVRQSNERTMDERTLTDYVTALKDLFIIEDMEAWNPNIRSKTSIRSTPTRHFVDTSIACRALRIGPEDLINDLESLGLFFEDMAVRDLRVYASVLNGEVRHYRDNSGLECDAVIHLEDGRWAAVEIKLGGDVLIEEGAANLKRLKKKIEEKSSESTPAFLMVLTAVGPMFQRPDGVIVMPINCLKA
ncbi:MAG: ATP-binding protein [Oscillospiraceae bacterium]|nr:ATP-binding protein [Oscillospiraceae bacterium]